MDTERCIATEVLDRLSAAEAWEYRVIPCAFRGKVLVCYGEEGRDYTQVMEELEVLTGNTLVVEPMAPEERGNETVCRRTFRFPVRFDR